jgi:hypothetical protein
MTILHGATSMVNKTVNLRELFKAYIDMLVSLDKGPFPWKQSEWTGFIKKIWGELGRQNGYSIIYTKPGKTTEYMFDLAWIREPTNDNNRWIQLALESEWKTPNDEELLRDFHKLTDAKAYQKVYIFEPKNTKLSYQINLLANAVKSCAIKLDKEEYLLIPHTDQKWTEDTLTERIQGFLIDSYGNIGELGQPRDIILR